jgi:hypothetical protein
MSAANRLVIVRVPACRASKAARTAARLASVAACASGARDLRCLRRLSREVCARLLSRAGHAGSLRRAERVPRRRTGRAAQASTPDDRAPHDLWCRANGGRSRTIRPVLRRARSGYRTGRRRKRASG